MSDGEAAAATTSSASEAAFGGPPGLAFSSPIAPYLPSVDTNHIWGGLNMNDSTPLFEDLEWAKPQPKPMNATAKAWGDSGEPSSDPDPKW